jgi:hypothetical protein
MLANNRLDAANLVKIDNNSNIVMLRALLKSSTVDSYVAAMTKLHKV